MLGDIATNLAPVPPREGVVVLAAACLFGVLAATLSSSPPDASSITIRTSTASAYPSRSSPSPSASAPSPSPSALLRVSRLWLFFPRPSPGAMSNTRFSSSLPSISLVLPRRYKSFRLSTAEGHTLASTYRSPNPPVAGTSRPSDVSNRSWSGRGFQSASAAATMTTDPGGRCGFWRNQLSEGVCVVGAQSEKFPAECVCMSAIQPRHTCSGLQPPDAHSIVQGLISPPTCPPSRGARPATLGQKRPPSFYF